MTPPPFTLCGRVDWPWFFSELPWFFLGVESGWSVFWVAFFLGRARNMSQLFHTWSFHRINKFDFSENPIPPIKNVAIIFSPNVAKDLIRRKLTYEARWLYALWNPEMREYQLALPK